jgi:meso-butanediol dehydrogenase/(S,S)-butanediol dehydrogenase/diacetyl reductase
MELRDTVAIVTGGARGIGRGIAYELAKEGVRIAVADLPSTEADRDETIEEVRRLGSDAKAFDVDVRDWEQVRTMAEAVVETFGRVDILVNNAGVITVAPVVALTEEDWDRVIDVNLKGTFLCAKAVAPKLMAQRSGRIVNLSSMAGKRGSAAVAHYCTSKFGVIGFTQSLAHEMAPFNVTVNAVCPGEVDSYMWQEVLSPAMAAAQGISRDEAFQRFIKERVPLGRPQTPEDIGQAVVFLCRADNITGEAVNVTGGSEMG